MMRMRSRNLWVWLYFFVTGMALSLVLSGLLIVAQSSPTMAVSSSVPTVEFGGARVPSWQSISFDRLPPIASSGSYYASSDIISQLGYDPSRSWTKGQKPEEYLALGDFQDSFSLENFDLDIISQIVGLDLDSVSLASLGLMPFQTLQSLVDGIESLAEFPIREVLPVQDLIEQAVGRVNVHQTIGEFLERAPHLGELAFADLPLDGYALRDIPNLDITPIERFKDWQRTLIGDIPGLSQVPFSDFPNPPAAVGNGVGIVDVVFGAAEQQRQRTISGSTIEGFEVSCEAGCAHVELSGTESILGRQWVSGKYQETRGGFGVLAAVNGGKEPVGRHLFGDAFKVVLWDMDETTGTATSAMFFRMCQRGIPDLGCTPYFIGPLHFMTYQEMDSIFLGQLEAGDPSVVSTPTQVAISEMQAISSSEFQPNSKPSTSASAKRRIGKSFVASESLSSFLPPTLSCSNRYQGVVLDAFAVSLSQIEGDYDTVGVFTCDSQGYCGRGLGAMQFMSYRDDVRSKILAKSGGKQFLARLDQGESVSREQLLYYFSPVDQQDLFEADARHLIDVASQEIDPKTGDYFTDNRLLERIAQMHFGGVAVPIDSPATDIHQEYSVQSYGSQVASNYQRVVASMGCP